MARYTKTIKVKDCYAHYGKIHKFLEEKKFSLTQRKGELVWRKSGFACDHYIKIEIRANAIIIYSFIDTINGAEESSKGFFGGFGKWPLHKIVKQLEKMIIEGQNEVSDITKRHIEAAQSILGVYTKAEIVDKVGLARIETAGIEFGIKGRYAIKKNFRNMQGYHFAFEIESTKLVYMPSDFDDVCDLQSTGFTISAGYHDGYPLTGENESGIVLKEISNLAGGVLSLRQDDGYILQMQTVESDWISEGAVKIIKQIENSITISFKFAVPFGLNDVITGTVELIKDDR
ncbi:MAG: hypothetical protein FWE03_04260 [Firmicutes bacterium]|nr:hypothetical protein [Bacillota bacterium]